MQAHEVTFVKLRSDQVLLDNPENFESSYADQKDLNYLGANFLSFVEACQMIYA